MILISGTRYETVALDDSEEILPNPFIVKEKARNGRIDERKGVARN